MIETEAPAHTIRVGWFLQDLTLPGTHGQRVLVQWTGHHDMRKRTYIAGVEERSLNPVQLAYDDSKMVKVWHE